MTSPVRKTKKLGLMERPTLSEALAESLAGIAAKHKGGSAQNQRDRIMETLMTVGAVSTIEIRKHLDVLAPAPRILELRRIGKRIATHWVRQATDCGKVHRVGLYVLES